MKRLLFLIMPFLAITFNSCSKDENIQFQIDYSYSHLDFNARTSLTKYVYIDTNTEGWDCKIVYNTSETAWCEIERVSSTSLKITCTVNENEDSDRDAYIEFYIKGKVYGMVNIYQGRFIYTDFEKRLIEASRILNNKYSYVNLQIDFESSHNETSYSVKYKGVLNYTGNNLNLRIPVILNSTYIPNSSTSYYFCDNVYMSGDSDSGSGISAYGYIYTGWNVNFDGSGINGGSGWNSGEFDIKVYGYDNNSKYINITLKNP